ncbi:MAG: asparagine synthase (glutamine-hydrolyzing) [Chloroflexota bacterium]|nr:asparagine synthase (glutamine-hydrolyzing) [Chloroflexota bacterium]
MCGIVGMFNLAERHCIDVGLLKRMLGIICHRGPDEFGIYKDGMIGMGSARLSIIDLSSGQQPICNEDETVWIVFNGEIFNYIELRAGLERQGHRFTTNSDTEVIVHLYEEYGPRCLEHLNGQFAIALWDKRSGELLLARDRVGIRPLFYTMADGALIFGSEIKAILLAPHVEARIDPLSLAQVFTFWAPLTPRTIFRDIFEVPPGHFLQVKAGARPLITRYWSPAFPEDSSPSPSSKRGREEEYYYVERLRELLIDATRLRLRADVPVGAYLSGGLDSSTITALIRNYTTNYLKTFSIAFGDREFDEREYQERMVAFLGTDHRRVECANTDVGQVFPEVIWHTEVPILRTSPAPMYFLSRLVHENDIKVVLTGEGADEFLGGYNIYKEAKVRRFWAKVPDSQLRPLLLRRLYPYVPALSDAGTRYLQAFFRRGLTAVDEIGYSHHLRWQNTARLKRFFSADLKSALTGYDPIAELERGLDGAFTRWSPLAQAQYLEISIFMSEYLLSSQGDRMLAANSVEGRFPFLDHRVIEFCNQIPPYLKLRGLQEKYILKKSMEGLLPAEVCSRPKRPYRAPISPGFFPSAASGQAPSAASGQAPSAASGQAPSAASGQAPSTGPRDSDPGPPPYVEDLLSPDQIGDSGYFDPTAVSRLVGKCRQGASLGENDSMALAGILSLELVHHLFVKNFPDRSIPEVGAVKMCVG